MMKKDEVLRILDAMAADNLEAAMSDTALLADIYERERITTVECEIALFDGLRSITDRKVSPEIRSRWRVEKDLYFLANEMGTNHYDYRASGKCVPRMVKEMYADSARFLRTARRIVATVGKEEEHARIAEEEAC